MKKVPGLRLITWFLAAASLSCSAARLREPGTASSAPIPQVSVGHFVIEPHSLDRASANRNHGVSVDLLLNTAVIEARKSLGRHRIPGSPGMSVTGVVHAPLALPAGVHGLRAASRKGTLTTAEVRLLDASGKVLRQEEETIHWNDVRWLKGGPKSRRSRPPEEVVADAVRKAVARAIERLAE